MTNGAPYGLDPVARLEEQSGDLYQAADHIGGSLGDGFELVAVIHGPIYLCKTVNDEDSDPYWWVTAEIREGLTGSWDSASDKAANSLPDNVEFVDVLGDKKRYVVEKVE